MRMDDGRVVSNFIIQALQGKDITVYGDGNQTRSFCYIDDLVDGIMKMMNSKDEITGPINLGNPNEIIILQLAKKIIQLTHSKSKIKYMPLPIDDPANRCPEIRQEIF
jgi:UDP-glucuronate decarboxylase